MMASITSQFQKATNRLTGSTMYQGIDGHLCDNVLYHDILLSCTNYAAREKDTFASVINNVSHSSAIIM